MRKYKFSSVLVVCLILAFINPLTAFANSSWYWISETRPYDMLPFVIILTLTIEIAVIQFVCKIKSIAKLIFFIILANILSFASPYIFLLIIPSLYTFEQTLEHLPFYTIGMAYLFITLFVEIPIVCFTLRKETTNEKALLISTIGVNIFTTILTGIIERTICTGSW